ncbi:MAG TPA: endonuclease/exonuclease/phosphatase family protein [Flavobacteriales bacterium]|nr:endonuclease/exonuclease/phosphatase family protein [Flavobacteriales bacterium]
MRRAWPLFALVVLCAQAVAQSDSAIKVITWNIRYDNAGDGKDVWPLRKGTVAAFLKEQQPGIIGLQECLVQQVKFLDSTLIGYTRFGVGRDDGKEAGEFSPVYFDASRFSLLEGLTVWLSTTPDQPSKGWDAACVRIATCTLLWDGLNGDSLFVINTHWDHEGDTARLNSARIILNLVGEFSNRNTRTIVMGDFNDTAGSPALSLLGDELINSCPADHLNDGTFNGFGKAAQPLKRIDHVYIDPDLWKVMSYDVPKPLVNSRHASDHFPVVITLSGL